MSEAPLTNHSNHHAVVVPAKPRETKVERIEPPDGGARAYLVMVSAFLCNGILFGIINTYSVIYLSLQRQLTASGDEAASSKACESPNPLPSLFSSTVRTRKCSQLYGFLQISIFSSSQFIFPRTWRQHVNMCRLRFVPRRSFFRRASRKFVFHSRFSFICSSFVNLSYQVAQFARERDYQADDWLNIVGANVGLAPCLLPSLHPPAHFLGGSNNNFDELSNWTSIVKANFLSILSYRRNTKRKNLLTETSAV